MSRRIIISISLLILLPVVVAGFGCKDTTEKKKSGNVMQGDGEGEKTEINMWGLWDDSEVFDELISTYQQENPNIAVNYKKYTYTEYEQTVIEALAAGKGPDIWMIHNTWLPKHKNKLGAITEGKMSVYEYQKTFVDVAAADFISGDQIYGFPLYVDTLALYYNKDLFNTASIASPPSTWKEFKSNVKSLTKVDEFGDIQQAGASIGTAKNINRAVDVLYLLMLQNGTKMVDDEKTAATFDGENTTSDGESYIPGLDALIFYTDFANPKKTIYTWNRSMPFSIDAFVEEKAAMMFNYAYYNEVIKSKAPKMNYGIASVPQIEGSPKRYDYSNYWGWVVSNASDKKDASWDFLTFLAKQESVKSYCETTGRPASRRDVVNDQLQNPDQKIFAQQALTAQSWYQADPSTIESIFTDMIESVALGEKEAKKALDDGVSKTSVLMNK
ncbi:extracellular solute-binding protein [Patescibacteria group bacterium]|nr:extracellular solute-binding protein [Patescibacteria group bacterium]